MPHQSVASLQYSSSFQQFAGQVADYPVFISALIIASNVPKNAVIFHRINGYLVLVFLIPSTVCGAIVARRA